MGDGSSLEKNCSERACEFDSRFFRQIFRGTMQQYISVPQLIQLCGEYDRLNKTEDGQSLLLFILDTLSPSEEEVHVAPDHNC